MRPIFKNLLVLPTILITVGIALYGCDSDYTLKQQQYGGLYMVEAQGNAPIYTILTNVDTSQSFSYHVAYGGAKDRKDIKVTFQTNPAMVTSYNAKHMTSYSLLPKGSYTLQTEATISSGKNVSSALNITIKPEVNIPQGQYMLPITVKSTNSKVSVNKLFQTAYLIFRAQKLKITAADHNYATVFAGDALNPDYLYFLGYPKNKTEEMVWKYDISGDSVLAGFPKKVTDVFAIPYPEIIPTIKTGGWLFFSGLHPTPQLYIFGNGHYYTYDIETKKAGPLHPITDLSTNPWPPKNFPKRIECTFYAKGRHASYLFVGDAYEKIHTGPLRAWFYPNKGHLGVGGPDKPWPGIPVSFTEQGFSGAYFDLSSETIRFFSNDEFVVFKFGPGVQGDIHKITKVYKGL